MDHLAGDEPGPAQHRGGVLDLPLRQRHADRAGGDRPLLDIDMGLHVDLDAEPGRLVDQEARRADPALAEMKVVADRDAADSEPLDQIMVNEILRRGPGAGLVEGHHDGAGEPGSGQQPQLGGLVGEPELGGVRAEKAARMRLEGQRQRRPAMRAPHLQRGRDHGAVAEMDAVEIAHRHHRSLGDRGGGRGIADNDKVGRHFSGFFNFDRWGRDRDVAAPTKSSRAPIGGRGRAWAVHPAAAGLTGCLRADASAWEGLRGIRPDAGSCWFVALGVVAGSSRWRLICRCRFWWWMTTTP